MGLVRRQRVGEGMYITGRNRNIEITILSISGEESNRKVRFKIKGNNGPDDLELSASQGYFNLTEDIRIEVSNKAVRTDFVAINYDAPRDYKFRRRENERDTRLYDERDTRQSKARVQNTPHPVGFYCRTEKGSRRKSDTV